MPYNCILYLPTATGLDYQYTWASWMSESRRLIVRIRGKFRYPVFACAGTHLTSFVILALYQLLSYKPSGSSLRRNTMTSIPLRSLCLSLASRPTSNSRWQRRKLSVLARQVERATRPRPEPVPVQHETHIQLPRTDPYSLVASELARIRQNMQKLLAMAHPGLAEAAVTQYYLADPSNQLRSLLVLLFAQATNGLGGRWEQKDWDATCEETSGQSEEFDRPLTLAGILNEWNLSMRDDAVSFESPFSVQHSISRPAHPRPPPTQLSHSTPRLVSPPELLPTQIRLAQIVEMIHIASNLHNCIEELAPGDDDYGNKISILGGDFLLGRASTALSRLGESKVVELVASVISNLVEGEFLGMEQDKMAVSSQEGPVTLEFAWETYLRETYLKTASLMAKGARSAVILGGCQEGDIWAEVAYAYGRNLGIAHQVSGTNSVVLSGAHSFIAASKR